MASVGMSLSAPSFLERVVLGREANASGGRRKTLIAIFQRGAVDGLNMVVPFGESNYYDCARRLRFRNLRQETRTPLSILTASSVCIRR